VATAFSRLMDVEVTLDKTLSDLKKMDECEAACGKRFESRLFVIRTKIDTLLGTQAL
jgi:hypothetical protein